MEELLVKVLQYYIAMYNLWKCVLNFTISFCILSRILHIMEEDIYKLIQNTDIETNKSNVTRCKVG